MSPGIKIRIKTHVNCKAVLETMSERNPMLLKFYCIEKLRNGLQDDCSRANNVYVYYVAKIASYSFNYIFFRQFGIFVASKLRGVGSDPC